jgi:hypothetical protein
MSEPQIEALVENVEGIVYGHLVDAGVDRANANRISLRASTRIKDMVRDVKQFQRF